jgi:mitotic spindle assembly checkpoint protein MAD1
MSGQHDYPPQQLAMSRKRSATAIEQQQIYETEERPPPYRPRFRHHDVLSCEVETLKAELQHERSLRAIDAKRFVQEKHRLQQQLNFAIEETRDVQTLMKETLEKQDRYVEQLKKSRLRALEELRQIQDALGEEQAMAAAGSLDTDPRVKTLQQQVQAKEKENTSLKDVVATLQGELNRYLQREATTTSTPSISHQLDDALSEARPDVMKELSRVRILLAESERKNRQYHRAVEEVSADLEQETKNSETIAAELQQVKSDHKMLLDKFGKLREAVYLERSKAEQALQRADEAEALAGKGSFDPAKTRLLHLSNNPLTEALREEIKVLKRQVEVLSGGNDAKKVSSVSNDVDPTKFHQRLKQSFKEQIGRFREGVYLMTGYKVRRR